MLAKHTAETTARLSVEEAATYTGLSASTLNKLRVYGGGPAYLKLGQRVVYVSDDLDAWLGSKRRRSTSDLIAAEA
jgi:predicted DNA-binding transcriptional regulator AlpA